ncbi:MAG: hypothetical protein Q8Q39_05510 [bacterium]|nr:hypothetical protein [bacterium]
MPFLFPSQQKSDPGMTASTGFIVAQRPTAYGPAVIVLVTLLGVAFVVFALIYSFRVTVDSEIELLTSQADDLERSRDKKTEAEILIFERRINALSTILRSHRYVSQIFPLVESLTLPTVFYDSFNMTMATQATSPSQAQPNAEVVQVQLQAKTPTLTDLARQMVVFRDDPRIKKGEISSFSVKGTTDGTITFSAQLTFDKKAILAQ